MTLIYTHKGTPIFMHLGSFFPGNHTDIPCQSVNQAKSVIDREFRPVRSRQWAKPAIDLEVYLGALSLSYQAM